MDQNFDAPHASMTCTGHFTLLLSVDKVFGAMSDKALWRTVKVAAGVSVAMLLRLSVMTHLLPARSECQTE